jgi:hypothetical protein
MNDALQPAGTGLCGGSQGTSSAGSTPIAPRSATRAASPQPRSCRHPPPPGPAGQLPPPPRTASAPRNPPRSRSIALARGVPVLSTTGDQQWAIRSWADLGLTRRRSPAGCCAIPAHYVTQVNRAQLPQCWTRVRCASCASPARRSFELRIWCLARRRPRSCNRSLQDHSQR